MTDPAAPVVTLRMSREDAVDICNDLIEDRQLIGIHAHFERLLGSLESALAAPEPPADDLAALIAECEARGWEWTVERSNTFLSDYGPYTAAVVIGQTVVENGWSKTPAKALRAAMDAARQAAGAGDGAEG